MAKPQRGLNENRIARLARSQGLMLRPSGRMFVLLNNGGGGGHALPGLARRCPGLAAGRQGR
jgi:hypothetical protein